MKVLFDEDVPHKLVRLLPQHEIQTVVSMKWGGIRNGALLTLIERERFHALLTGTRTWKRNSALKVGPLRC